MILDAGCGEGFYALALQKCLRETGNAAQVMAFDIAADAIRTAAKSGEPVKWMVADITNIPVRDKRGNRDNEHNCTAHSGCCLCFLGNS